MGALIDLIGRKFGRLTVVSCAGRDKYKHILWECRCCCGKTCFVTGDNLKCGNTRSCGCLSRELSAERAKKQKTHGMTNSRLYGIYNNMKQRCCDKNNRSYKRYGGRGITVCDEWLSNNNGFINFYNWAMENGYQDNLSIDRINNDGNYEPSNCRWVTMLEQANNRRDNRYITYNGETKNIAQWSEQLGVNHMTLRGRLARGWSVEKTLTTKPSPKNTHQYNSITYNGKTYKLTEWAKRVNIDYNVLRLRLQRGWSIENTLTTPVRKKNQK